jgi:hypothetical protein
LLRESDLPLRVIGGRAFIDFVGPQDEPWLRVLLSEMTRFEGRRQRELDDRLLEPLPCDAPHFKRRAASRVLLGLWRRRHDSAIAPREARAHLFTAAAEHDLPRKALLAGTAAHFGVGEPILEESLFADLPAERLVRAPQLLPTANEVALRTNLAVAQALLMRASSVEIRALGGVRPLIRLAKLRGLPTRRTLLLRRTPRKRLVGPSRFYRPAIDGLQLLPHGPRANRLRFSTVPSSQPRARIHRPPVCYAGVFGLRRKTSTISAGWTGLENAAWG